MIEVVKYPKEMNWQELCLRPEIDGSLIKNIVKNIFDAVKIYGDEKLYEFTKEFDDVDLDKLLVCEKELSNAFKFIDPELKNAIRIAYDNIKKFHRVQIKDSVVIETSTGVFCWQKNIAIEKVGLYIPGGSAPLFSTVLMLGIPAVLAGCKEIIICTPPNSEGKIEPSILYSAHLVGINKIYKVGGAQAIAAMTFGTETIPKVDKIFGPGNQFVTMAKSMSQFKGVAIDMPAGPSEVLVVGNKSSKPDFVASDLISQAEHGIDSQVVLVSDSEALLYDVQREINNQVIDLPRKKIILKALRNSRFILLDDIEECIGFSNTYAPEHLILAFDNAEYYSDRIINAGSVFLGAYSCESIGDYASGPNHTLPTNGFAKNYSGVSIDSFVKKITFQEVTKIGIQKIGPSVEIMAKAEQLLGHKQAVSLRLKYLENV